MDPAFVWLWIQKVSLGWSAATRFGRPERACRSKASALSSDRPRYQPCMVPVSRSCLEYSGGPAKTRALTLQIHERATRVSDLYATTIARMICTERQLARLNMPSPMVAKPPNQRANRRTGNCANLHSYCQGTPRRHLSDDSVSAPDTPMATNHRFSRNLDCNRGSVTTASALATRVRNVCMCCSEVRLSRISVFGYHRFDLGHRDQSKSGESVDTTLDTATWIPDPLI